MFSAFITSCLKFQPTRIDPDVYMWKDFRNGGHPYYEYLLVYVDDVLVVSNAPSDIMKEIGTEFEIKTGNTELQRIILEQVSQKYN